MTETPKHAIEQQVRGEIKLSDFKLANLHPKAKSRILMSFIGTFLIIFGCIYMLSMSTFYFDPDISTPIGLSELFKNLVNIMYIVGSILVIIILWHVMIKDCPISPAAKANYDASHDKSMRGVKIIAAMATAIANKGGGNSIDSVAAAIDGYFNEDEGKKQNDEQGKYSSN